MRFLRDASAILAALLVGATLAAAPAGAAPPDHAACWDTPGKGKGCFGQFPDDGFGDGDGFAGGDGGDADDDLGMAAVPLPPTVWLMLGAIVALGGVRIGRRATA